MQNLDMTRQSAPRAPYRFMPGPAANGQAVRRQEHSDELFVDMLNAYRASGGLARLSEVLALTRGVDGHEVARMAAWTIERKVVSFEWRAELWLPLFQFSRATMVPTHATQQVLRVLNPVLGPWALAAWFARPHDLLGDCSPADALKADSAAVLQAARAEQPMALG